MEKLSKLSLTMIVALLVGILLPATSVMAVMQLIPPIQEIKVQRGYTQTFTVTIKNIGDEDVPSTFSAHDMDIRADGAPFIADSSEPYDRGCSAWVTLDPTEAIIKSTESLTLTGRISVPKNAEGGYYLLIRGTFVGTTIPLSGEKTGIKEGSAITLGSQALVAVLVTVPSSRNKPVLAPDTLFVYPKGEDSLSVTFGTSQSQGWRVVMPVRNNGNIHTRVNGNVSFYSETGTRIESAAFRAGRGYILPEKVRNLVAQGENVLSDGYYMIRLNLNTEDGLNWTNSLPFAIYKGEVFPGAISDELAALIRASSPGFSLKEPFLQKQITPGGSSYVTVQLVNVIGDTLILFPRKLEWALSPIGQIRLGKDTSIQPRSCSDWIEFVDEKLILPPGRRASFKLKITSPKDAAGEYYSAIILDPEESRNQDLPGEFMSARSQLIALRTASDQTYEVKVGDVDVKKETSPELTLYRFIFKVKNVGNTHCFATGNLSLEREAAEGVYKPVGTTKEFGNPQTYILPGGERTFEIDIPDLTPGTYRTILATNYKRETQPIVKYKKFTLN